MTKKVKRVHIFFLFITEVVRCRSPYEEIRVKTKCTCCFRSVGLSSIRPVLLLVKKKVNDIDADLYGLLQCM